jgi:succinate dehydrogenase / fumarate reductase iron-sulfur subunit
VSVRTGSPQDANAIPVPKPDADRAMDAAACIGCGACVAACPNGSASLFTAAKVSHLGLLPQGQPERARRVVRMVEQMDAEGFGGCSWYGECMEACPKEISIDFITRMNGDYLRATLSSGERGR